MVKRAGRYLARPVQWGVSEKNNKPCFSLKFELTAEWIEGEWRDTEPSQEIYHDVYLYSNDGSQNEYAINNVIQVFGWDGLSFASLANGAYDQMEVQLVLRNETYKGKDSIKVKYINSKDYVGQDILNNPQDVQSLDAKYGSQLRATAPAPSARGGATAPPAAAQANPVKDAMREAWKKFTENHRGQPPAEIEVDWKSALAAYFTGRDKSSITESEWKDFKTYGFKRPELAASSGFSDDDIPFAFFDFHVDPFIRQSPLRRPFADGRLLADGKIGAKP